MNIFENIEIIENIFGKDYANIIKEKMKNDYGIDTIHSQEDGKCFPVRYFHFLGITYAAGCMELYSDIAEKGIHTDLECQPFEVYFTDDVFYANEKKFQEEMMKWIMDDPEANIGKDWRQKLFEEQTKINNCLRFQKRN